MPAGRLDGQAAIGDKSPDFATEARRVAFSALLEKHWQALERRAYRLTGNWDDAQDLLSDTLYAGFAAFGRFRSGSRFDWWLLRIMANKHVDRIRRQQARPTVSLESLTADAGPGLDPAADPSTSNPELVLTRSLLPDELERALLALPPEFRTVLVLVALEDCSYDEVATILGIPVGTVRSRLHRARGLMTKTLPVAAVRPAMAGDS